MRRQKQHDLANRSLAIPCLDDSFLSNLANAGNLQQTLSLCFEHMECLFAECVDEALRQDRTEPADHTR